MSPLRLLARRGAELLAALIVASLVAALTLAAVDVLSFPEPSWLPETAGTLVAVAVVVVAGWLLLRLGAHGRGTGERPLWLLGVAGPALLASSHLGLLLHGTPHYLFGLGGDQANRVSALTRFADSPALNDAFYADAAPFYPPQWFWVGGQLARIAGVEAWLVYKPYAIATMAIAGAIAFVAWRWLVPTRLAVVLGMVTAVIGGHTNAYEPYSWILICLLPQAVVATHLLCVRVSASARTRAGPPAWPLVLTIGVYLGWAALGYTLIAGFAALVVALVVVSHVWRARTDRALAGALLARLAAMAAISAALALLFWHRFLLAVLGGAITERSVANDFAPESGSRLPLPIFEVSAAGALCLIGLVWIVVTVWPAGAGRVADRGATSLRARIGEAESGGGAASVGGVVAAGVGAGGAGVIGADGSRLGIGFGIGVAAGGRAMPDDENGDGDDDEAVGAVGAVRDGGAVEAGGTVGNGGAGGAAPSPWPLPPPAVQTVLARCLGLLVAAVFGWYLLSGLRSLTGSTLLPFRMIPVITLALALAGVVGALALARWAVTTSPGRSRGRVVAAAVVVAGLAAVQMAQHVSEEDTQFAAVAHGTPAPPRDLLGAIDQMTGDREPSDLVVLSSDPTLTAYRPYFAFQATAQAYATPAGRYEERLDAIRAWSDSRTPRQLAAALDAGPFRGPDVLVLEHHEPGRYFFPAVINEMPLAHNNSGEAIDFRAEQFADPELFDVREVGSRVVIARP